MRDITESYTRIGDNERRFDIEFWQCQGDEAIFNAEFEMIVDYLTISNGHADEPKLQRTVKSYGRQEV